MVHDTIDIERCVWDLHYRRKIKRLLNFQNEAAASTANQNHDVLGAGTGKRASPS